MTIRPPCLNAPETLRSSVEDIEQESHIVAGTNVICEEIASLYRDPIAHFLGSDRFPCHLQGLWQVEDSGRQIRIPAAEPDAVQAMATSEIQEGRAVRGTFALAMTSSTAILAPAIIPSS